MRGIGRTGEYRVRRGMFGKSILQEYVGFPDKDHGDPVFEWCDVDYSHAPPSLSLKREELTK